MPCPFANAFGLLGEGFHAQRIFGCAANDLAGTVLLASLTTAVVPQLGLFRATLGWLVAAEVIHYALGVHTAFLERIGLNAKDCFNNIETISHIYPTMRAPYTIAPTAAKFAHE